MMSDDADIHEAFMRLPLDVQQEATQAANEMILQQAACMGASEYMKVVQEIGCDFDDDGGKLPRAP